MLSIFTIPKPFPGYIGTIQTNAIRSWLSLRPECEVILMGTEEGTADTAAKLGTRYIPEVDRNEYGTPLVDSVFDIAQAACSNQFVAYVNSDIILLSDFLKTIGLVRMQAFLLIGRRRDLDLKEPVNFSNPVWEDQLRSRVAKEGKLHGPAGIDYFVFPRGMYRNMPSFAIGRGAWDNWIVYKARSLKVPVIDGTKSILAIHQNHDYSHLSHGKKVFWKGPEGEENARLLGGDEYIFTVDNANWLITPQGTKQALSMRNLYFRIISAPALIPMLHFLWPFMKGLTKLVVSVKSRLGL